MDQLMQMKVFQKVVQQGGFAKAARKLGISPAAVTNYVANLEERLGSTLLHRTTRKMSLTETGSTYYERCSGILNEIEETETSVRQTTLHPIGQLKIGAPMSFGIEMMGEMCTRFLKRHPEVKLDIHLSDRKIDLLEEGIDVNLRVATELKDSGIMAAKIKTITRTVCASPEYLESRQTPKRPEDLKEHNCLVYTMNENPYVWNFRKNEENRSVKISGNYAINNSLVLKKAVLAGMGVGLIPTYFVEKQLEEGKLTALLEDFPVEAHTLFALYPSNKHLSHKVRAFIDFMKEEMSLTGRRDP